MKLVKKDHKLHDSDSPLLIGDVKESDVVYEVNEPSYIETHEKVVSLTVLFNQLCYKILSELVI